MRERDRKVGRNDPCPCGSGLKWKKCHGDRPVTTHPGDMRSSLDNHIRQLQAQQKQRQQQQGLGRPVISTMFQGYRFVAVGNKLVYSKRWKTFHDFLQDYIKDLVGSAWGNAELKKPREQRHPLLNWYQDSVMYMNSHIKEPGKVHSAPSVGVVAAYMGLAYDLYCLAHNTKVHTILLNRLRHPQQFYGAYYEIFVAASLLRADFEIEFEDETDSSRTHCEFTATFRPTGKKFSVEAKTRLPGKESVDVGNQLYDALKKEAKHTRLVFIEVNVPFPSDQRKERIIEIIGGVLRSIRTREEKLTIGGQPAPPAYAVVTNHPNQYQPLEPCPTLGVIDGFKIPDFRFEDQGFKTLRQALNLRERHREVFALMQSLNKHSHIPSTFEGEIPEFAFSENSTRRVIGQQYVVPDGSGGETVGELEDAVVMEAQKQACGIYRLVDGRRVMVSTPLSEEELAAYSHYPETFFGVEKPRTTVDDPLEVYDRMIACYGNNPREELLEWMKGAPDYQQLESLTQQELAAIYCERLVETMLSQIANQKQAELIKHIIIEAAKQHRKDQGGPDSVQQRPSEQ